MTTKRPTANIPNFQGLSKQRHAQVTKQGDSEGRPAALSKVHNALFTFLKIEIPTLAKNFAP